MKRFFWLFALLLPLFASGDSSPAISISADARFDTANKLYAQSKFKEAATAYNQLIEEGSISPALYFNLGNAFFKSGQIGRAIGAYRQAEEMSPRDPDVRANLQFARNLVSGPKIGAGWIHSPGFEVIGGERFAIRLELRRCLHLRDATRVCRRRD